MICAVQSVKVAWRARPLRAQAFVDEGDHALRLAYHVRRHAHAFFAVRGERLLQILRNGGVERVGWVGGVAGT